MSEREFHEELWRYAGIRVNDGKKMAAWQPGDGEQLTFYAAKGSCAIGAQYRVQVCREADHLWRRGDPAFVGNQLPFDDETYRVWQVESMAAEQQLASIARERQAKNRDGLSEAMEPLLKYAQNCRTMAARNALICDVIRRLGGVW